MKRVLTTVLCLAGSAVVFAQQKAQEGFVPFDETAPRETVPAAPLVFIAYGLAWIALGVYAFSLYRRVGRLEQDVADLKQGRR